MLAPTVRNFLKLLLEAKESKFFVVYKKSEGWISEPCPVCKGKGSFKHKGYTYNCKNCYGSGKIPKLAKYSYRIAKIEVDLTKFDLNNMEIKFPSISGEIYGFCKTWDEAGNLCRKLEKEKSTEYYQRRKDE